MKFNFQFGKSQKTIVQWAFITIVLTGIVSGISKCTHLPQNFIWDILDEVQRKYFPNETINDYIIHDPEKLQRRIHRDVDRAIEEVTPEYDRIIERENRKYLPRYFEKPVDKSVCYTKECQALGGEMRICSPFYDGCPDNFKSVTAPLTEERI